MRRLGAAAIDFIISYVLSMIVYGMMISGWKMFRIILGIDWEKYSYLMVIMLVFVAYILTNFIYSVFFDSLFHGLTFGKKITGCKSYVGEKQKNQNWIIKHALLRTVASILYVLTALYYIKIYKMPYDRFLYSWADKDFCGRKMGDKRI